MFSQKVHINAPFADNTNIVLIVFLQITPRPVFKLKKSKIVFCFRQTQQYYLFYSIYYTDRLISTCSILMILCLPATIPRTRH